MHLRTLLDDDDAVSPVIGVILMVAITVILAAVIATFVLGLGEQVSQTAPQASFTFDYDEDGGAGSGEDHFGTDVSNGDGNLTITHAGGATLTASEITVTGSSPSGGDWANTNSSYGPDSQITAGDGVVTRIDGSDTIRVVWTSQEGQDSAPLAVFNGPDA